MCGIAGIYSEAGTEIPNLKRSLEVMNYIQRHRGPDGHATWCHADSRVGFAHRRLSIIDLSTGDQPMTDGHGNWVVYNGEIYNYLELRHVLGQDSFRTTSDTECILQGYRKWHTDCVTNLRGMFAFALWDEATQSLFCARDRFGIKPFYYTIVNSVFYFASEIKTLLPFIDIETDLEGLKDYLAFQFCLSGKTMFKGIRELPAGHYLVIQNGVVQQKRYWDVYYDRDFNHTAHYFEERVRELINNSINIHLRSDVPVGSYVSGGIDSSIVASVASDLYGHQYQGFTGKFSFDVAYDESVYARELASFCDFPLHEVDITVDDFINNIFKVIYHLDQPVAGPGSFPQYMVSGLAAKHLKVVLGGQGGDEIFGGYVRYLIAYFEQCIKGAIDGTLHDGNFVVTYESIIPNLSSLKQYKPLLKQFWAEGLFEEMDRRYFHLIDRAPMLGEEINWGLLGNYSPFETFKNIFHGDNVDKQSYFDKMTHFDFKTLLPALLHVEDRMSMANGLESRVPFLDHPLIELAATIPSDIKFKGGTMKRVLKDSMKDVLPSSILNRQDKMGFPVPLTEWLNGAARDFIYDVFSSQKALTRDVINNQIVLNKIGQETQFGRTIWGLFSIEVWQQQFHDQQAYFHSLLTQPEVIESPAVAG